MEQEVCVKITIKDYLPRVGCTVDAWNTLTGIQKESMIKETILDNLDYMVTNQNGDQIEE